MSTEKFTTEWWRELFKKGKPIGRGGRELRDEDKYYFAVRSIRVSFELAKAMAERFGEEGAKLAAEVKERVNQEEWGFLLDALDMKPTDAAGVASVMASQDANTGNEVELNISPDGSTAEFIVHKCTLYEEGLTAKERCAIGAPIQASALMKAIGSNAKNVELIETDIDPPRYCRIVFRNRK